MRYSSFRWISARLGGYRGGKCIVALHGEPAPKLADEVSGQVNPRTNPVVARVTRPQSGRTLMA